MFEETTYMSATVNARSGIKDKKYTDDLIAADNCLMQFGKRTVDKFTLDYRHPLSPLQAFGIAISMILFNSNNQQPVQMMTIPTSNPQTPISTPQATPQIGNSRKYLNTKVSSPLLKQALTKKLNGQIVFLKIYIIIIMYFKF